jgi:hypothetical protein
MASNPHGEAEAGDLRSEEGNQRALAVRRWTGVRNIARGRMKVPSMLLLLSGAFLTLLGLVMLVGTAVSIHHGTFWPQPTFRSNAEAVLSIVWGTGVIAGIVLGPVIVVAAYRMEQLRSYWMALTGTILLCVLGLIVCAPLALLGIWPLLVLLNPDVRWAFTHSKVPDESGE